MSNVRIILKEVIRLGINRTWIASASWSTASEIYGLEGIQKIGKVYGFIMSRNEVPGFKEHVLSFTAQQKANNIFFHDYLSRCPAYPNSLDMTSTGQDAQNCSFYDTDEGSGALLEEIKQVNFTVDNVTNITFDKNGDPSLGYDIMDWEMEDGNVIIKTIGEYRPSGDIKLPEYLVSESSNVMVIVYNCSKACPHGQELNLNENTCCKTCNLCTGNQFSKGGKEMCTSCKDREYVSDAQDGCRKKAVTYLEWTDGFAIVLALFGVAGLIFTLLVAALFIWYRHTPIVKGTGGNLCFLILLSLFSSFGSLTTFIGEPSDVSCKAGLPFFVISFALCVSCILANLFQISVGFAFNAKVRDRLKRFNKPIAIVMVCTAVQVTLCTLWLTLAPPSQHENLAFRPREILIHCHTGSDAMFGTTLGYIGLLAVICFIFGFKGKQLPDLYKNSSFITISMLIYLVMWILFIPVYMNTSGKYVQAIEACAILVSDYSILFCHFCPKCYIMIFRKELNNEKAILGYIQKHYEKKGVSAVTANR
ncbi:hypothetical protein AAFF_G00148710 [Aldrovandia affinis]|uniref:G-protein coupled receptors family 3 profile domain-containing protein n=1 Tax=Aldrovandia affinis TaxID=143900 RepID=A0AAD7RPU7_9TELE|nr:hypothetical protein AAFF_G00148710 [Aldrovandia affinis]